MLTRRQFSKGLALGAGAAHASDARLCRRRYDDALG